MYHKFIVCNLLFIQLFKRSVPLRVLSYSEPAPQHLSGSQTSILSRPRSPTFLPTSTLRQVRFLECCRTLQAECTDHFPISKWSSTAPRPILPEAWLHKHDLTPHQVSIPLVECPATRSQCPLLWMPICSLILNLKQLRPLQPTSNWKICLKVSKPLYSRSSSGRNAFQPLEVWALTTRWSCWNPAGANTALWSWQPVTARNQTQFFLPVVCHAAKSRSRILKFVGWWIGFSTSWLIGSITWMLTVLSWLV